MEAAKVKDMVRRRYGQFAKAGSGCGCSCGCSTAASPAADVIGERIGYTKEDLAAVPDGANLGLGCGNPVGLASIREGDTVLDLGSGAGFDCFLASRKTGPGGHVIGVDMTPEMLERARGNAQRGGYTNVEFRQGEIERLPVDDNSVDVIISNCVINLSPDKPQVFREAYRVLRPGGRLCVSDIVLLRPLPWWAARSVELYVGCVAGALLKKDYLEAIRAAGFPEIEIVGEQTFGIDVLDADPNLHGAARLLRWLPRRWIERTASSVVSMKVTARKPA